MKWLSSKGCHIFPSRFDHHVSRAKREPIEFPHKGSGHQAKVLFSSQENTAGPYYNHDLVQSMFITCLETEFQDDNVASKMRSVLKDKKEVKWAVAAENEQQTKLHSVSKTKVNKVINAATATHAMPCDVETKAKEKPKQKPEGSVQAKLLAAVETK